jgi:hypothetical protein
VCLQWQRIKISKAFLFLMSLILPITYFTLATLFILKNLIPNRTETKYFADPDYAYLLNGLTLNARLSPLHVDHPGTPLQALNTLLVNIVHKTNLLGTGNLDLVESVTLKPQEHLVVLAFLFASAQAIGLFLVGLRLMNYIPFEFALVAQAIPLFFLSNSFCANFFRNTPEGLIYTLILFSVYMIIPVVLGFIAKRELVLILVIFSFLIGIAAATKVNVWIIAFIMPILFRKLHYVVLSYLTILFTFLFFVVPIFPRALMAGGFWLSFFKSGSHATSIRFESLQKIATSSLWPAGLFLLLAFFFFLLMLLTNFFPQFSYLDKSRLISLLLVPRFLILTILVTISSLILADIRNPYWFIPAIPFLALGYASCLWGIWVLMGGGDTKNLEAGNKL